MKVKSTYKFDLKTPAGVLPASTADAPMVDNQTGEVSNLPDPEEGVLFLVNAVVFKATSRHDFVMADDSKTIREGGKAVAQQAFVDRLGVSTDFVVEHL